MLKCKALTKEGKKCSRNAEPNSNYCWQHQSNLSAPGPSPKRSNRQSSKRSPNRQKTASQMTSAEYQLQKKFCDCIMDVKAQGSAYNPWAVCTASVGRVSNKCKEFE